MLKKPATDFEVKIYEDIKETEYFKSRFNFLKGHNGIRPNSLHGMIAPMGVGKTTLLQSIIADIALEKKVLIWLSEESLVSYQQHLRYLDDRCVQNLMFVEERDIPAEWKSKPDRFLTYFKTMVERAECDIVFIDNVTTSGFYDGRFGLNAQPQVADFLSSFVKSHCSVFYLAHTKKDIIVNHNKIIVPEDMRNTTALPNVTELFYIIQGFTRAEKIYNFVRVAKYRGYDKAAGWFALEYVQKAYVNDSPVDFSIVNDIFKSRDFLGKKS